MNNKLPMSKTLEKQKEEILKKIEEEKERQKLVEPDKYIAELLHGKLCNHNHTDGCGWFYDDGSWKEYTRKEYLEKANNLLSKGFTAVTVKTFLDCIR